MKTTTRNAFRGMTLVELLVVITIMVLLLAAAVPQFKPALESQHSAGAARTVSLALERARLKAMQEKRPCGVEFMRYHDAHTPNLCLQMQLIRSSSNYVNVDPGLRVKVDGGTITLHQYSGGSWVDADQSLKDEWSQNAQAGYSVQFGRQGRFYKLSDAWKLTDTSVNIPADTSADPVDFLVQRPPSPMFSPPINLPHGTVVDLQYSGFGNPGDSDFCTFGDFSNPNPARELQGIKIIFSPSGHVSRCDYTYWEKELDGPWEVKTKSFDPQGGLFYFLVGEWERQGTDDKGNTLAADGRNNLLTASNTWVTVHPRTGRVNAAPMAAVDSSDWKNPPDGSNAADELQKLLEDARAHAKEHYRNLGEY